MSQITTIILAISLANQRYQI